MSTYQEYLRVIDLTGNASLEDIKKSYRELLQIWHPDKCGNNENLQKRANKKVQEINKAYSYLIENYTNRFQENIKEFDTDYCYKCGNPLLYPDKFCSKCYFRNSDISKRTKTNKEIRDEDLQLNNKDNKKHPVLKIALTVIIGILGADFIEKILEWVAAILPYILLILFCLVAAWITGAKFH